MRRILWPLAALLSTAAVEARADDAQARLGEVDEALNQAKDQFLEYEMVDIKDGKERTLSLEISMKGERRLTAFTAPADLRGTKVLIVSPTQMYVYLPAYKKVRRVASHVTEQGFMGTTYSNDDLALTRYSPKYNAKLTADDEANLTLDLTKKSGEEAPYARIVMIVEKKRMLPLEMKYYDAAGKNVKTETRSEYTCEGKVCAPSVIAMRDHTDGDHISKLVRKKWKVNSGLSDRLFSKRSLARAR